MELGPGRRVQASEEAHLPGEKGSPRGGEGKWLRVQDWAMDLMRQGSEGPGRGRGLARGGWAEEGQPDKLL